MAESDTTTCDAEGIVLRTESTPGGLQRRTMLKGLAVAGVTVPFLAACGGSSDSGDGDTTTDPTTSAPETSAGGSGADALTTAADVPVGGGVILGDAGYVITQPTKGTFEGFTSVCTHMQCTVNNVADGTINCICHGSKFSIEDGSVVNGPATSPLAKKPVKVDGSDIVSA